MKQTNLGTPVTGAVLSAIALALFYFAIVSISESFSHAISEFVSLAYLLIPLLIGFGLQVGLYLYVRENLRASGASTSAVAAGTGTSTLSMIACCAHHFTDILPFIGLTVAAAFFAKYQILFLIVGLCSNLVGITIMLEVIQKNRTHSKSPGFFTRIDFSMVKKFAIALSLFVVTAALLFSIEKSETKLVENTSSPDFSQITKDVNGVSVAVKPTISSSEILFDISLDTHQDSPATKIDLATASQLVTSTGTALPLDWSGSPPGGHHRSGTLRFTKPAKSDHFELIINMNGQPLSFKW